MIDEVLSGSKAITLLEKSSEEEDDEEEKINIGKEKDKRKSMR
jgi:hypothetical protein